LDPSLRHISLVLYVNVWIAIKNLNVSASFSINFRGKFSEIAMSKELSEANCYVALTHDHLDATVMMDKVRSPKAGAIVLFAGAHTLFYMIVNLTHPFHRHNKR
jgi:hypothetical protein